MSKEKDDRPFIMMSKMNKIGCAKGVVHKAILRSNPHKMVKLPKETIEKLGWDINEKLVIDVCDVENMDREQWTEVVITKESDEHKICREF